MVISIVGILLAYECILECSRNQPAAPVVVVFHIIIPNYIRKQSLLINVSDANHYQHTACVYAYVVNYVITVVLVKVDIQRKQNKAKITATGSLTIELYDSIQI